jgi:hypothetical protein
VCHQDCALEAVMDHAPPDLSVTHVPLVTDFRGLDQAFYLVRASMTPLGEEEEGEGEAAPVEVLALIDTGNPTR